MGNLLKDCSKSVLEKMNLFVIFQIVWIIEFHILGIFSVEDLVCSMVGEEIKKPQIIAEYSQKIANWMDTYKGFILAMGIVLILVGISGTLFKHMPILENYNTVNIYSDFGLYAGLWLLLIFYTYDIYMCMGKTFLIAPVIVYILFEFIKKIKEWLETKGITFSG